jgi:hypothetical protein
MSEFDVIQQKDNGKKPGKRERSQSSFFQEIIGGFQEQHSQEIKHEFEEYGNVDIDDICFDITTNSINEILDIKNKVKGGVDAIQNNKTVGMIRKKKTELEKALHSAKNIRKRDRSILIYCTILLYAHVYLLGAHPGYLFLLATAVTTVVFFWTRLYLFNIIEKPSLIFDFPYYCSVIFSLFLVHFPGSQTLYLYSYCSALGSLSISVYYLMDSLIMHKLNSIIDLFIKLGPLVTMWNVHWNIRGTNDREFWGFYDSSKDTLSVDFICRYMFAATLVYAVWALPYFIFISMDSQRYGEIKVLKERGVQGKFMYFVFHYLIFIGFGTVVGITAYFCQLVHVLIIIVVC